MKKYILLLLAVTIASVSITAVNAQNYYHPDPADTIRGNGFTYICDRSTITRLRNINNTLTDVEMRKKNGSALSLTESLRSNPKPFNSDGIYMQLENIINSVFTNTDKANTRNENLITTLYINSDTGRVMEVVFGFRDNINGFGKVPPERYYQFEQRIKQEVIYTMTAAGKQRNFNMSLFIFNGSSFE